MKYEKKERIMELALMIATFVFIVVMTIVIAVAGFLAIKKNFLTKY